MKLMPRMRYLLILTALSPIVIGLSGALFTWGRPWATSLSTDPVGVSAQASSHVRLLESEISSAVERGNASTDRVWRLVFVDGIAPLGRAVWFGMLPWSVVRDLVVHG